MKLLTDRRAFMQLGTMAAASAALPLSSAATAPKATAARPIQLGIASYTFRSFSRAKLIEFAKQLEISALNLKDVKDHLPSTSMEAEDAAIADYKAAGFQLTAGGTITFKVDDDADIRPKFEYAKRAGLKVIVAGSPPPPLLRRLEKFVKEYDIRFALHNHGPEDPLWKTPLDVIAAMKGMDSRMGCCVDVGHCLRGGVDPVEAIRRAGPRVFDVHMKDLSKPDAKESQVAVGRGIMPVKKIFSTLRSIGYAGHVDLEYEIHADDPMPGVIESFAYMRGVLAGM